MLRDLHYAQHPFGDSTKEGKLVTSLVTQVVELLSVLPDDLQRRVLEYVESLDASVRHDVPGTQLIRFAGTIPPDDLQIMEAAIEAGCEQVDLNEW